MEHFPCAAHAIFQYGHIVEQIEGLKDHTNFCPVSVDLSLDIFELLSVIENPSAGLMLQTVDASKQGGFS